MWDGDVQLGRCEVIEEQRLFNEEDRGVLGEAGKNLLGTLPDEIPAQVTVDYEGVVCGRRGSGPVCGDFWTAH